MQLVVLVRDDTQELKYALRSFKNIQYDELIIVGHKPGWVKNATHVRISETHNKHVNIARCVKAALDYVEGDFIIAEDDHFVVQPTDLPCVDRGSLNDVIEWQRKRYKGEYLEGMLYAQKISPGKSFELHRPMIFNRALLKDVFGFNKGGSFQYRTIYGNYYNLKSTTVQDFKVRGSEDFAEWPFISTTNATFRKVKGFLQSQFPDKSSHE